ncbi:MAG: glycosyl hydrolase 2 galactose-binding domain-containing protein [Armatimonadota bacterium]
MKNLASAESGAIFIAEPTSPSNGKQAHINDGYNTSYWYAGDNQPKSDVMVILKQMSFVHSVRFLSWETGRHAPSDYRVFAINSLTGESHLMGDVKGDTKHRPDWVEIKAEKPIVADQVLLKITDTQEHEHGALLYELEVMGSPADESRAESIDPNRIYLMVDSGPSLSSQSTEEITMTIRATPPGGKTVTLSTFSARAGFRRQVIDLSKWEGKTIGLTFEVSSVGKSTGVWLAPRLVKGTAALVDLAAYWSAYHDGSISDGVTVGDDGTSAIACSMANGKSSITINIPVSAQILREKEADRLKTEYARYGASDERLQPRDSTGQQIDLTGKWQMAGQDSETDTPVGSGKPRKLPKMTGWQWYAVSVPGSVRSGLLDAGIIEDPYWSSNAGKSLWTEKKSWWFKKTVNVPKSWAGEQIKLGFDGVDYYSSIWINGKFLGDHEGMYGGPVYDVTPFIKHGTSNEIIVQVHPGGTDEPGKVFKGFIFMKWHYQTDISPRGIWRGARLVATGPVKIENAFVKTLSITGKEAMLEITADVYNPGEPSQVAVTGTLRGENVSTKEQRFSIPMIAATGKQTIRYHLRVADPKLWWPSGMGEPNLYRVKLTARTDNKQSDSISAVFGIKTIEFEQNPGLESEINSRFMCRVNGKLISMRGAGGFGAHDQIYRFHDRKDAWFIKAALALNYNFIRVHGSGIIATDEFYNLCDKMGMMVWQEFMISNSSVTGEHPDVWRAQTIQSILRLRNHPSLIRWCGGNEFNPDTTADDTKMIVDMFEECVARYDGTRLFSRAAQYVNDPHYNDESGAYGGQKPAACTEFSGVFAGNIIGERSLRKFLADEDIKQWPPVTKENLDQFLPSDLAGYDKSRRGDFVFHTALTGRCEGWGWPGDLTVLMLQWVFFGVPRTMDEAYDISQVCGGYSASYIMETFRSRWPYPSLYASWDYAPIWPMSIIWGPVDYYGAIQPSGYYYKRAQEPLHVLMQLEAKEYAKTPIVPINSFSKIYQPGDQFKGHVFVVSDLDHPIGKHTVRIEIFDSKLDLIHSGDLAMDGLEAGPSSCPLGLYTWDIPASMPNQIALVCVSLLDESGKLVSRSAYPIWITSESSKLIADAVARRDLGPWLTDLRNPSTSLKITSLTEHASFTGRDYLPSGTQGCASVSLLVTNAGSTPSFHTGIEIVNADCRYICDDNYFMLMPGESKKVTFEIDRSTKPFFDYVKPERIEPITDRLVFAVRAWNAPSVTVEVSVKD